MKPNSLGGREYQKKQKPLIVKKQQEIMEIITVMDTTPLCVAWITIPILTGICKKK